MLPFLVGGGGPLVLTRSAHDFGADLLGGEIVPSADLTEIPESPPLVCAAVSTALVR